MSIDWNWGLIVAGAVLVLLEVAFGGFAGFDLVLIGSSFVLGGGLGHLMTSFLSVIRDRLDIWAINPRSRQIPIVNALYQAESGIVGSAALCLPRTQVWLSAWQKPSARDATAMPKRVR